MKPDQVFKVMIRKRLMAMNRYTEMNVQKAFDRLTTGGTKLEGIAMTSKPELIAILDKQILEVLDL